MNESAAPSLGKAGLMTLIALVALGPLSTDLYLPALPALREGFAIDEGAAQGTLSGFLIGFALAMPIYGPLSDRFGRKPVLLFGIALFALASALCAIANSIEALILYRILQALGGCAGPVICRAIVRDVFGAAGAARVFSYLSAAVALAPAIAPILGGGIAELWGWRACFLVLTVYGALGLAACFFLLPETNIYRRETGSLLGSAFGHYRDLTRHRDYLGFVLVASFGYSGIFCFISGSSFVLIEVLGIAPRYFGFCFSVFVIGYIVGAFGGGRLGPRFGPARMVKLGGTISLASALVLFAFALFLPPSLAFVLAPLFPFMVGIGLTLPNAQAGAIGPFPRLAGAASALLGFVQMLIAASIGGILGWIGSPNALPMTGMILACALALWLTQRFLLKAV